MRFVNAPRTRRMTVLAQDPSVLHDGRPLLRDVQVFNEDLDPGPAGHRFRVIDYDASANAYIPPAPLEPEVDYRQVTDVEALVADPRFHAQNAFAIASATLLRFEAALGRHVSWGFLTGAHQLKLAPHAFEDANAFYSREDECLAFGYFPKRAIRRKARPKPADFVFTCLSYDIVAHETTHAVLDGLRSEFNRPASVDQAALHEAIADIVALLSAFSSRELLDHALPSVRSREGRLLDLALLQPTVLRNNVLLGLAEEFGSADAEAGDLLQEMRGAALRRSASLAPNGRNYQDARAEGEEHDLGEILVAALMNVFLEFWWQRAQKLAKDAVPDADGARWVDHDMAIEQGVQAADHLLGMTIRAIDYLPPLNVDFRDFLSALVTADAEAVPDDSRYGYRRLLLATFKQYGIAPAEGSLGGQRLGQWQPPHRTQLYGFDGHAEMTWDREAIGRFLWENRKPLELNDSAFTTVVSIRPVRRVGPSGFILRETVVEYMQLLDVAADELPDFKVGRPEGLNDWQTLRLQGGGTLIFDDYGRLKYHIGSSLLGQRQGERLEELQRRGLLARGRGAGRSIASLHRARALRPAGNRAERW